VCNNGSQGDPEDSCNIGYDYDFLHRMMAKNLYLENPMSATLTSLSKINYSRWRPVWPLNSVSVIFQLLVVLEV